MAELFQGHEIIDLNTRLDHLRDIQYTTNGRIVSTGPNASVLYVNFGLAPVEGLPIGVLSNHYKMFGNHKIFSTQMPQEPHTEDAQKLLLGGTFNRESYSPSNGITVTRLQTNSLATSSVANAKGLAFTVSGSNVMNFIDTISVTSSSRQAGNPIRYLNTIRIRPIRNLTGSNSSTRQQLVNFNPDFSCTYHTNIVLSANITDGVIMQGARISLREAQ